MVRGLSRVTDDQPFNKPISSQVKIPVPEGPTLSCPKEGSEIHPQEYWSVGVME
jgi:hypothetical protein